MFTTKQLPLRATNIINEYSKPLTRPDWRNSKSVLIPSFYEEDIDKINVHTFILTILIIVFNIIIVLNVLYLMCVIIGCIVCIYNSHI